jgi:phage gp29-like protein
MWFWPRKTQQTSPQRPPKRRTAGRESRAGASVLTREVAAVATDLNEPLIGWLGVRPNRDPLLEYQQPDSAYGWPYGLFEEALDKDAHLAALTAQRKAAVLGWERSIVPADESPQAQRVARFVEAALDNIGLNPQRGGDGGFEHDLAELLDAIPYGLAVSEILWERTPVQGSKEKGEGGRAAGPAADRGRDARATANSGSSPLNLEPSPLNPVLPQALLARHPRRFIFDADNRLRLLTAAEPVVGEALPARKFLVFAPYGRHENPYGHPQLRSVWWLAYFKRQVLRFWVMFCEKYGTPTAVLKHPLAATDSEKRGYRRIIGSIQQETGLVVPEGVELSLLEAERHGGGGSYRELIEFCNREMSKALLGQTLTTETEGRGSYALGRVHQAVRADIVRQDAQALMALVNTQLVRWIVDLNFPAALRLYPRWQLTPPRDADLRLQLEIDRFFSEQGLALDEGELYARYGRDAPASGSGEQMLHPGNAKGEVGDVGAGLSPAQGGS